MPEVFPPSLRGNVLEMNPDWLGVGHVHTCEPITLAQGMGVPWLAKPGYAHPYGKGSVFCHQTGGGLIAEASETTKTERFHVVS